MSLINCVPYLIYFLFLIIFVQLEINRGISFNNLINWEMFGFLFFFGMRGFVMSDVSQYYQAFENESDFFEWDYGLSIEQYSFEPGFRLFEKISHLISSDYFVFQFLNSFVDFILLSLVFRRHVRYYSIGFLIFFMMEGCMYEINLLRNMKSIMLFLISIPYIQEKKLFKYVLLNVIGMSFHVSAVVYIPLYWILNKEIPKALIISVILAGLFIPLFHVKVFQLLHLDSLLSFSRFATHIEDAEAAYSVGVRLIERTFVCILILFFYDYEYKSNMKSFFNLYLLYFACFNILYEIPIFPERVAGLFLPSAWIVIPYFIYNVDRLSITNRVNIVFLYGLLLVTTATLSDTQQYSNILFSDETYDKYLIRYENAFENLNK